MDPTLKRRLIGLAAEQAGVDPDTVCPEQHFTNDLHFDSLAAVEFAMDLEDEFHIAVPDEQMQAMLKSYGNVLENVSISSPRREGSLPDELRALSCPPQHRGFDPRSASDAPQRFIGHPPWLAAVRQHRGFDPAALHSSSRSLTFDTSPLTTARQPGEPYWALAH